jgi:hypothetical protein
MLNKVIIKPNTDQTPSGMVLGGSYQCGPGKIRVLVSEDSFIEVLESDKTAPSALNIMFNERTPFFTITYDPNSGSDYDKRRREGVEKFFGEHPLVMRNGKPTKYTKSGMYDMYSEQEKTYIEYETWKENLDVMNRLDSMADTDLRDVWYYYGVEPSGKKRGELIVKLGAIPGGLAINDMDSVTKKNKFMMMFSGETKAETEYIVNMRKALMNGIIDNKVDGTRSNYYHGTTFIGTSFNDVIAYAKREDRIYKEHIIPRLNEADSIIETESMAPEDDPFAVSTKPKSKKGQ